MSIERNNNQNRKSRLAKCYVLRSGPYMSVSLKAIRTNPPSTISHLGFLIERNNNKRKIDRNDITQEKKFQNLQNGIISQRDFQMSYKTAIKRLTSYPNGHALDNSAVIFKNY